MAAELDWWQSSSGLIQPKAQIADYIESEGISTPRRYETLEEALAAVTQGATVIMRSEHPEEYDGPSGLLGSYIVNDRTISRGKAWIDGYDSVPELIEELDATHLAPPIPEGNHINPKGRTKPGLADLERIVIGQILDTDPSTTIDRLKALNTGKKLVKDYANITRQSVLGFTQASSFSFWEYRPGVNVTVVADDAVEGQYHVFSAEGVKDEDEGLPRKSYGVISDQNGNPIRVTPHAKNPLTSYEVRSIISQYEKVRNLGRFTASHCPIVELQIGQDGELLFLQYHRSRDTQQRAPQPLKADDYPERDGWIKADAVRGQIQSPAKLLVALGYPDDYGIRGPFPTLPDVQDGSMNGSNRNQALNEILARRSIVSVVKDNFYWLYSDIASRHGPRSFWFKPQVSLAIGRDGATHDKLIPPQMAKNGHEAIRAGLVASLVMEVASDGTMGYIRRDPNADEVVYDSGDWA